MEYLIVCPLVFIAGFIDAIAGGGGLISLPAYMISGIPVHFAIATNKMSSSMGTSVATIYYAKNGYIKWKLAFFTSVCALIGAPIGSSISLIISDYYLKILMLVILPITAFYVFNKSSLKKEGNGEGVISVKTYLLCMIIAFFIGIYDGFYGPGTGTFLMLLLTGVASLTINDAQGITKVINLSSNIASLITFLINGKVIMLLGFTAGLFSIAGNFLGARFFKKGGVKIAKPVILTVLTMFFVKILFEIF